MRKSLVALIAGALIIGGAAIAMAQTDDSTTETQPPLAEMERGEHLSLFLAEMVDENVITQEQADTLLSELQARFEARRADREEHRAQLEAAFADDILTVQELEDIGAYRILDADGPFAEALADGELTRAEFDAVHATMPPRGGGHHGGGFGGPGGFGPGGNA